MQFVLVAGVSGHLAALTRLNTASSDVFAIPALVAAGAFSAYLLVVALLALPLMHKAEAEPVCLHARFWPPWHNTESRIIAVRVVTAVAPANLLSLPFGMYHSYWPILREVFQQLEDRGTRYDPLLLKLFPPEARPRQREVLIEMYRKGKIAEAFGAFKKIYLELVDEVIDHLKSEEAGDSSARKLAKR
jgi:hypothetical protein